MFSQTIEYALRSMVCLASAPEASQTTRQLAAATKVPPAYLSKVLQQLIRQGLVVGRRGVGGGFTLSRPPEKISILEVVNAVDPLQRIRVCPLGLKSHGVRLCPLHKRMDNALAETERAFARTTLAEVLNEPSESKPLCEFAPSKPRRRPQRSRV